MEGGRDKKERRRDGGSGTGLTEEARDEGREREGGRKGEREADMRLERAPLESLERARVREGCCGVGWEGSRLRKDRGRVGERERGR